MIALILLLTLPADFYDDLNSVKSTGFIRADITLNLNINLILAEQLTMDTTILDEQMGAYRIEIASLTTGTPDAKETYQKFLVLNGDTREHITFALFDGEIHNLYPKGSTAIVMDWTPENEWLVLNIRNMKHKLNIDLMALK